MRKKHQPGCPCCTTEPPTDECGCTNSQIRIDVENADDICTIQGVRFIGGPCDYLDFTGFSAINGTYYIDWPEEASTIELGRWAATNGPLYDMLGTGYCVYAKLILEIYSDPPCSGVLCLCFTVVSLFEGEPCPNLEDIELTECLNINCGIFTENNDFHIGKCVADDQVIDQPTANDVDCPTKYYHWEVSVEPV